MSEGGTAILYAELLANLGQVSVAATLPKPPEKGDTRVNITDDGQRLFLDCTGFVTTMLLPAPVATTSLKIADGASRYLTWRLPLSRDAPSHPPFSPENQAVPWAAPDLEAGSAVTCERCHSTIIPDGKLKVWKDLPSENWAEMMEFWHCHKPHDRDQQENKDLADKGYGANNNVISAQSGVGFVDIISFMFDERDCQNLLFSASNAAQASGSSSEALANASLESYLHVFCSQCKAEVGSYSIKTDSVLLLKPHVSCRTIVRMKQPPTILSWVAALLVANISRYASTKSLLIPKIPSESQGGNKILYLWVLNPHVVYSSSCVRGRTPAMKILYQEVTREEGNKLLDSMTSDVQEIHLPSSDIELVRLTLEFTARLLPETERTHKEWRVGLLDKWEAKNKGQQA
ncbi:uncharacterized protein CPUR_07319 [Claviceps purpurea 20.1]|uniref:Ubiquitin-conjugating enzyme E2C-binding protein n=1 Tax=Claviceps purpurea (strain 20.1) TaxID=1111077 RepID=M1WB37_CLAP2|nr:hypothetical protein E4U12_003513 [Claviceps purpurea]KAG6240024.1 hypothetical protein E4U23_007624 [Claviceps purpurea]KAG6265987.1 hypothetical protein E4U48_005721 [Claviceps purpurea]CCE33395.1 uncharacterized protein CPUR_07319 [Claviceps purpurea 20.1]